MSLLSIAIDKLNVKFVDFLLKNNAKVENHHLQDLLIRLKKCNSDSNAKDICKKLFSINSIDLDFTFEYNGKTLNYTSFIAANNLEAFFDTMDENLPFKKALDLEVSKRDKESKRQQEEQNRNLAEQERLLKAAEYNRFKKNCVLGATTALAAALSIDLVIRGNTSIASSVFKMILNVINQALPSLYNR